MFLQVSRATSAFSECLFERVSSRVNDTLSSSWIAIENAWRFLRCVSVGVLFVLVKTISVYGVIPVGIGGPYQIWNPVWDGEVMSVIVCSACPNSQSASKGIRLPPD